MALARIITNSQACSRELALDLLARGYAVEIVSPDRIPNDIADLELRVDEGPGDHLIASVKSHEGERSASLEFVHHLKSPMMDFIRRPSEPREPVHSPEPVPVPAPQLAVQTFSPAAEIPLAPDLGPGFDFEEAAHPISPPLQSSLPPAEPTAHSAPAAASIAQSVPEPVAQPPISQPTSSRPTLVPSPHAQPLRRSATSPWRAALTLASIVLLALLLGFGLRQAGKASSQNSKAAPPETVAAASTNLSLLSAPDPAIDPAKNRANVPPPTSASPTLPPVTKSEVNPAPLPRQLPLAKAGVSTARGDGLIARDTVTYLDKRFEQPAPKAKSSKRLARRHPGSQKHGDGVIAANKVTYLTNQPTPKAPTQDSVNQPHSNPK
jgi:hypothetical protein